MAHPRVVAGFEERRVHAEYQWDGLKRGGDPARPEVLWQYTLAGHGEFERDGKRYRVGEGDAFFALLPSNHRYGLPRSSSSWRFFWLMVWHPYVSDRLGRFFENRSPVQPFAPRGESIASALALVAAAKRGEESDAREVELLVFRWVIELEREVIEHEQPDSARRQLMNEFRVAVLERLPQAVSVETLAEKHGLSRSAFSHFFRNRTGMSPGAYAAEVRLAEAEKRLRSSEAKLEAIARETGFADANHFCKAFRRHYGVSPGSWRGRVGGAK